MYAPCLIRTNCWGWVTGEKLESLGYQNNPVSQELKMIQHTSCGWQSIGDISMSINNPDEYPAWTSRIHARPWRVQALEVRGVVLSAMTVVFCQVTVAPLIGGPASLITLRHFLSTFWSIPSASFVSDVGMAHDEVALRWLLPWLKNWFTDLFAGLCRSSIRKRSLKYHRLCL